MADQDGYEDDTSDDPTQTGSGPLAVLAGLSSQYVSKEGHDIARKAYDQLGIERSEIAGDEDDAAMEERAAAEEAKTQLRAARQRLMSQKADQSEKWLALAEGLGSPTHSGGFGETIANVAHGQREVNKNQRAFYDDQADNALKLDQGITGIDAALARSKAAIALARRTSNTRLMQETLKTLSKETRSSSTNKPLSANGKKALDEGKELGSPEFFARVQELNAIDTANQRATAGTDSTPETPETLAAKADQAHELGVPIYTYDPYKGMSTKLRQTSEAADRAQTAARLDKLANVQSDAANGIAQMNRFMNYNKKVDSGFFAGMTPAMTDAEQQMDAITSEVSRKMKQPGEGSTSDFDAKMFIKATVSRSKKFQANRGIAIAYKLMRNNEIDRASFMQDYATLNGNLRGADAAWRGYLEANPIFDPSDPNQFKLNQNRKKYKQYFQEQMGDRPAEGTDPGAEEVPQGEVDLSADDDLPGHYPGEDIPAHAEGGRVGATQKVLYQVVYGAKRDQKIGTPYSRRASAMTLRDKMVDKHPNESFYINAVTPEDKDAFERFADGGPVTVTDEDVLGDGDDPETHIAKTEPDDGGAMGLREALYAALQGGTLGLADEAESAVDPGTAAKHRSDYSEFDAEHPVTRAAAFAAGMTPLAALVPGGSLLQMGALGAGTGAVVGAAGAEDDRGVAALRGGVSGAASGVAASLAAKYAYNKVGQLVDRVTGKPLSAAEEKLVTAANRDGVDLAKVAADLRAADRLQVPQGLENVGGRRTRALIEKAATRGGAESEDFLARQGAKQDAATGRVEGQINKGLAPSEYFGEMDKLQQELYTASKPLYDAAYKAHPGVKSQEFMRLMDTADGKSAFKTAMRLMALDGKPIGKADATGMVKKPSLEFLDYFKRGLDQAISTEEATKPTTLGHSLRQARNRLRDELDNVAPEYKTARAQYAGDLEVRDALKAGREDFLTATPEEVRRKISAMSFAEKDAYRSGVSQHLFEQLGRPSTDFNAARKLIGSDSSRAKLEATFDDPKKWKIFEAALNREADMFDQNKKMGARIEGKKTQALGKEDSILSSVMDSGMSNTPGMGGISWTNRIYNWLRFPIAMSEKNADEVLRIVKRGNIKEFDATMQRLAGAQKRLATRSKRAGKMGAIAAMLAAGAMQPTAPGDDAKLEEEGR